MIRTLRGKEIFTAFIFVFMCGLYYSSVGAAATIELSETGQTTSYAAGDDAAKMRGAAWPNPRFTVNAGAPDNGGSVTDKLTGLVWAKDANVMPARNPGWDVDGTANNGAVTWQHALDYVTKLNAENYLGHNDWRLPTVNELQSLINDQQTNPATWLNTQGFTGAQLDIYWSSTTYASGTGAAWLVHMFVGFVDYNSKTISGYVWPVRAGQSGTADPSYPANTWKSGQTASYDANNPQKDDGALQKGVSWPSPRFTDNANGTVTDNLTDLIWLKNSNCFGVQTWANALSSSNSLASGSCGLSDGSTAGQWRLPNREELYSLIDFAFSAPALSNSAGTAKWTAGDPFTNAQSGVYWSSTTYAPGTGAAWNVVTIAGNSMTTGKTNGGFVWPVRAGGLFGNSAISVSPSSNDFGAVTTGSSSTPQTITITNTGTNNLYIGSINITNGADGRHFYTVNDNCRGTTIAPLGTCSEQVYFSPIASGAETSTLTVWSNAPSGPASVSLSGLGVTSPSVTAPSNQSATEGGSTPFNLGSFSDSDGTPWSVSVNWGDGSSPTVFAVSSAGSLGTKAHAYADNGMYTVTVQVTDTTSLSGTATFNVIVTNAAPTVDAGTNQTVYAGDTVALAPATFTDSGTSDTHTATINWGDGTSVQPGVVAETGGSGTVSGSHVYASNAIYTVAVTVIDDDGGAAARTLAITVLDRYTVTATATGNGTGSVSSNTGGISYTYPTGSAGTSSEINVGTSVTLTAMAATGSTVSWTTCTGTASGNDTDTATCIYSSLYRDETAQATFSLKAYTITTNAGPNGSITCIQNPVNHGASSTCTISANTGYSIATVIVDASAQTPAPSSYIFNDVQAAHTISVTFADTIKPSLTVSTLSDGAWTSNGTLNVSGEASDEESGLLGVTVNDSAAAVTDGAFSKAISLTEGANFITVIATDNAGNTTTDSRTINYDPNAPVIVIDQPADNSKTNVGMTTVSGYVDDYSSVTGVTNNSSPVTFGFNDEDGIFSASVPLTYGTNTIEVTAEDLALNTASEKRTVTYDNLAPSLSVTEPAQDISTDVASITIQGEVTDLTIPAVTISIDNGIPETLIVTSGRFEKVVTFTQEKTYVITVTAEDEAGNTSSTTRNIIYNDGKDTTPDPFTFTNVSGVPLSTVITSNSINITGIDAPTPISIEACSSTLCQYSIDGGTTWVSTPGTVINSNVRVRLTSSGEGFTNDTATLNIGGVSGIFRVTTINTAPVASKLAPVVSGMTVTVHDTSTDAEDASGAMTATVQCGNGTIVTGPDHSPLVCTYASPGTYVIKHSVKDTGGLGSSSANVSVSLTSSKYLVSGTLKRQNGTAIPYAIVKLKLNGVIKHSATTNSSGAFSFGGNVVPGTYTMTITKAGISPAPASPASITVTNANVTGVDVRSVE